MRDDCKNSAQDTWSIWHDKQFAKLMNSKRDLAHSISSLFVGVVSKVPSAFVAAMAVVYGLQSRHEGRCATFKLTCNKCGPGEHVHDLSS